MSARGRSAEIAAENGEAGVADGGPGLAYMSFVVMEDLLDKLKLLNYEEVRVLKTYRGAHLICQSASSPKIPSRTPHIANLTP